MPMKMPFIDLKRQYQLHKEAFDNAIHAVLNHGQYIHGPEVTEFENQLQRFANVRHAVTCGNGTDALALALQAMHLQKGDVVFVPSLTFAATAEAVVLCGGIPFFVDIDDKTYNLSIKSLKEAVFEAQKQSLKTAGVIAVDLFGLAANYTAINEIAKENLLLSKTEISHIRNKIFGNNKNMAKKLQICVIHKYTEFCETLCITQKFVQIHLKEENKYNTYKQNISY